MFDKLIESAKQKQRGRTGKFFFVTSLVYCVALAMLGILTVFWFNPTLVEAVGECVIPLPPPLGTPAPAIVDVSSRSSAPSPTFAAPRTVAVVIPSPGSVLPALLHGSARLDILPGNRSCPQCVPDGVAGAPLGNSMPVSASAPAPPPPPPTPKVEPTPTPKTEIRMTSQLLQGNAIRKVQPPYPQMARAIRLAGSVQVQVMISESGLVTDAFALNGHPFFRDISVEAARQWIFKPTMLNDRPVRVTGVITFNFRLDQ